MRRRECAAAERSGRDPPSQTLTVTHIFLLWAKDLISLADPAALGGRARERTCSMKPVIGPRPSSGRPTWGCQTHPPSREHHGGDRPGPRRELAATARLARQHQGG